MVVVDLILISLCSSVRLYRKSNLSLSKIHLKTPYKRGIIIILKKVPTPKWMLPRRLNVLTDTAYPVCRQDRHFYFRFFFLLLRKASNAITRLPKAHNNVSMPRKIERISKAVIGATSLPSIPASRSLVLGGYHPVMGTFRKNIVSCVNLNNNH